MTDSSPTPTTHRWQVVTRHFPFQRLGQWGESRRWYAYPGEISSRDGNAVYVRDLVTSSVTTLVPPNPQAGYNSIPKFAEKWIVSVQDGAVWRIRRDGTEKQQLFPPVER